MMQRIFSAHYVVLILGVLRSIALMCAPMAHHNQDCMFFLQKWLVSFLCLLQESSKFTLTFWTSITLLSMSTFPSLNPVSHSQAGNDRKRRHVEKNDVEEVLKMLTKNACISERQIAKLMGITIHIWMFDKNNPLMTNVQTTEASYKATKAAQAKKEKTESAASQAAAMVDATQELPPMHFYVWKEAMKLLNTAAQQDQNMATETKAGSQAYVDYMESLTVIQLHFEVVCMETAKAHDSKNKCKLLLTNIPGTRSHQHYKDWGCNAMISAGGRLLMGSAPKGGLARALQQWLDQYK